MLNRHHLNFFLTELTNIIIDNNINKIYILLLLLSLSIYLYLSLALSISLPPSLSPSHHLSPTFTCVRCVSINAYMYTSSSTSPFYMISSFTLFIYLFPWGFLSSLSIAFPVTCPSILYIVLLSSHHVPMSLQSPMLDFLWDFLQHQHNIPDMHPLSVLPPTMHSLCETSAYYVHHHPPTSIPDLNVFTLFTVSHSKWISTYWCSLSPKYDVFFLLIFIPRSSVILLDSSSNNTLSSSMHYYMETQTQIGRLQYIYWVHRTLGNHNTPNT